MARHIKNIFSTVIPQYESWKINLIEHWNTILGDLYEHVTLINIKDNRLVLGVYDAVWLQELYILSPVLIKTINDYLGSDYVANLRFKNIGYKKKQRNITTKTSHSTRPKTCKPLLSSQEQTALIAIGDSELRNALERYLIRCKEK